LYGHERRAEGGELDQLRLGMTPLQIKVGSAIVADGVRHGSVAKAARELGITADSAKKAWKGAKKKARLFLEGAPLWTRPKKIE
jgi:hypothetical protein